MTPMPTCMASNLPDKTSQGANKTRNEYVYFMRYLFGGLLPHGQDSLAESWPCEISKQNYAFQADWYFKNLFAKTKSAENRVE